MLEQVLIMLVNYVDTAMVGALGANATASVALTASTNWLVNGIFTGVAIGFAVPIGQALGGRNVDHAKAVVRQAILAIFVFGLAFTGAMQLIAPYLPSWMGGEPEILADATSYITVISLAYVFNISMQICSNILRCTGDTRTPLIFNVSTNVINMVLNFLLIYETRTISVFGLSFRMWGAGMGVTGAAIATAIATAFSGLMLIRSLFLSKFVCCVSLKDSFRFDKKIWGEMIRLGTPVAFERMAISFGQIFMTKMVTGLGTASLAAHSLGMTAESITYMPAFGFSSAATTLVSQSIGARKPDLAHRFARYCTWGCVIFMSAMGFVLYFGGGWLMSLFTPSAEVVEIGASALKVEALAQPFFALSMVISGVLRGAGKTKWPFVACLIGMWAVRLPVAYLFTAIVPLGLTGAWIGMAADLTVRGLISLLLLRGGKWADNARLSPEPCEMPTEA